MTNAGNIIVPSGIQPVHSFDLWGTLVVQKVLGPRVLEAYQTLMVGQGVSASEILRNTDNYQGVLDGRKEALENKKANVDAVEDHVWPAYQRGEVTVNFNGAMYIDCLQTMVSIAKEGEGLCILTTGNSPWVKQALTSLDTRVGQALGRTYSGDKSKPAAYERAMNHLASQGQQMVSHTEDQLKGLAGILGTEMKKEVRVIYVERENLATKEDVLTAGADHFVHDLREVPYTEIAQ